MVNVWIEKHNVCICTLTIFWFFFYKPDIANPLKPTASTRKEMATPLLWEYPTTSSNVASMPNPVRDRQQVAHRGTQSPRAVGHHSANWIKHDTSSALNYVSDRYEINVQAQSVSQLAYKYWTHRFSPKQKQNQLFSDEQLKREQFGPNTMKVTPCSCAQRGVENHISASVQASHLHSSWFSWQWSLTGCSCCVGSRPAGLRWARWWSSPNGAGQTVCPPTMAHRKWTKSAAAWCPQKERSFDWGTVAPDITIAFKITSAVS